MQIYLFRDNEICNLDSKINKAAKADNLIINIIDFESQHIFIEIEKNKKNTLIVIVHNKKNNVNNDFLNTLERLKKNIKVKTIELCTNSFLINNNLSENNFMKDSVIIHGFQENIWIILTKTIQNILEAK